MEKEINREEVKNTKTTMEEAAMETNKELFEEVEEVVTAGWTGCASCCS